jgi:hypothetical protein
LNHLNVPQQDQKIILRLWDLHWETIKKGYNLILQTFDTLLQGLHEELFYFQPFD